MQAEFFLARHSGRGRMAIWCTRSGPSPCVNDHSWGPKSGSIITRGLRLNAFAVKVKSGCNISSRWHLSGQIVETRASCGSWWFILVDAGIFISASFRPWLLLVPKGHEENVVVWFIHQTEGHFFKKSGERCAGYLFIRVSIAVLLPAGQEEVSLLGNRVLL